MNGDVIGQTASFGYCIALQRKFFVFEDRAAFILMRLNYQNEA